MSARSEMSLERIQRWLQAFIVDPACDHEVEEREAETAHEIVRPTARLTSAERAMIYRDQYLLRMEEALEADFPTVQAIMGKARFFDLVSEYVQAWPSRSYNLNRLSDHFADYLATATHLRRHRFLHDVARLEYAICQVFEAEEVDVLTPQHVADVPPEAWSTARLHTVPAFRLLALNYPANACVQAVKDNEKLPSTRRSPSWVVVYRRDYGLHRLELTRPAYDLLSALADGQTMERAIENCAAKHRSVDPSHLFTWFSRWISEGMFASLEFIAPESTLRVAEASTR